MKKLLYIILAIAMIPATDLLPYKFFLPMLVGSILIIVTQINLYIYDRKKTTTKL
jgi:hypothetical protein